MSSTFEQTMLVAVVLAAGFIVMLGIGLLVVSVRLGKIRKRYNQMMGDSGVPDLEQVIVSLQQKTAQLEKLCKAQANELAEVRATQQAMNGYVGVHRYNAFSEHGNDLSFSLAFLNKARDGVVISGLHNRENTYVYAKPLTGGLSAYPLSSEEEQAITLAVQQGGEQAAKR